MAKKSLQSLSSSECLRIFSRYKKANKHVRKKILKTYGYTNENNFIEKLLFYRYRPKSLSRPKWVFTTKKKHPLGGYVWVIAP